MQIVKLASRSPVMVVVCGMLVVGMMQFAASLRSTAQADDAKTAALLKAFVTEFVEIKPGTDKFPATFLMGVKEGDSREQPQHEVTFKHSFAIAKYEMPQNLYEAVMGNNPSRWKGLRNSVETMTWAEANEFCQKISQQLRDSKLIGIDEVIRLPTEAEWEYCCRAGTTTKYSFGDEAQRGGDVSPKAKLLDEYGWHTGNAAGNDPAVGVLKPNPWGLYDMHGYLWEFTSDEWTPDYKHASKNGTSPVGPDRDEKAVTLRSGSWKESFEKLSSSSRRRATKTTADDAIGLRCVKAKQ
ncbi:MAG: formylglycine-generating enzyme family protein [Planctomycetales bacterium]|nr:formylglycine-generating enzyme family protein [Planctomycetales bacterium]